MDLCWELDLVTHKLGKMQGWIDVPVTKLVRKSGQPYSRPLGCRAQCERLEIVSEMIIGASVFFYRC